MAHIDNRKKVYIYFYFEFFPHTQQKLYFIVCPAVVSLHDDDADTLRDIYIYVYSIPRGIWYIIGTIQLLILDHDF